MRATSLVAVLPAAILLPAIWAVAALGDELPDPVASHFGVSGAPDRSMSPSLFFLAISLSLVVPGLGLMLAAALKSSKMPRPMPAFLAGMGAFLAAFGAAIVVQTVLSQRGLADWQDARSPGVDLVAILFASVAAGVIGALVAKGLPFYEGSTSFATSVDGDAPTMNLDDAERAVFVETISARWMLWLDAVLLVATAVLGVFAAWWVGLIMLVSAVPVLILSSFRVQADRKGLAVRSSLFGIRFARIELDEIERATVIDVEPMQWGGWGYRGSLKMMGSAAVVIRRGPGIHLQLSGKRSFVVTLDDPVTPAAILNAQAPALR
ncbi:MAG: DUF1648 domain-containing protein [Acidimicrobiales bacterium]|nr:DUF1648 domain-containing protein [Acidimicrobiales bacterium]